MKDSHDTHDKKIYFNWFFIFLSCISSQSFISHFLGWLRACEKNRMNRDPLEASGQDRRSADRMVGKPHTPKKPKSSILPRACERSCRPGAPFRGRPIPVHFIFSQAPRGLSRCLSLWFFPNPAHADYARTHSLPL